MNSELKKIFFGLIYLMINFNNVVAQTTIPSVTPVKPPEASAIDKMLEMPVSYYTGIPSISIPLYEITLKGLSIPITLNYHAGGIRVDQESTTVGLGWNLDFGGNLTRSVKSKPDDYSFLKAANGGGYEQYGIANFLSLPTHQQDVYLIQRNDYMNYSKRLFRLHDYRPDEFYYSVQGYSGRFMLNQRDNKFVFFPKEDIKVGYTFSGQSLSIGSENFNPIRSWKLTLPNGTIADFGYDGRASSGNSGGVKTINSWMIKSLTNVYNENVVYEYDSVAYDINLLGSDYYSTVELGIVNGSLTRHNFIEKLIKKISFPNGTINFIYSDREDLPSKCLTELQVINAQGDIIKDIKFFYSYFQGDYGYVANGTWDHSGIQTGNSINYDNKRLRLDYITVGQSEIHRYSFDYYSGAAPSKRSYSQDFWGYFNGGGNNCFAPKLLSSQLKGADKLVNNSYNKVFSLKSITYPVGGKTEFIYEGNAAKSDGPVSVLKTLDSPALTLASASISMYGSTRLEYGGLTPDEIGPFGEKYFRKTFTIPSNGGNIANNGWYCQTNYFRDTPEDNAQDCYNNNIVFKLEKVNSNGTFTLIKSFRLRDCSLNNFYSGVNTQELPYLNPGDYRITTEVWFNSPITTPGYTTQFTVSWLEQAPQPQQYEVEVGGLRIKDIKYYNHDGTLAKQKSYSYDDATGVTSGQLISFPIFIRPYLTSGYSNGVKCYSTGPDTELCQTQYYCPDVRVLGDPIYPLETTSGSYLGYTNVKEETVSSNPLENLVTQYTYSFKPPIRDEYYQNINTGILEAQEWERGKLLKVEKLKKGNTISKEEYEYYTYSPGKVSQSEEDFVEEINSDFVSQNSLYAHNDPDFVDPPILQFSEYFNPVAFYYGVDDRNIPQNLPYVNNSCYTYNAFLPYFHTGYNAAAGYSQKLPLFKRYTGFDKLKKKTTTTTDDNGNSVVVAEDHFYDNVPTNYQLTRTQTVSSAGESLKTEFIYASQLSSIPPYDIMQTSMPGIPIKETRSKNNAVLNLTNTNYKNWGSNLIAPISVETQQQSNPIEKRFEYFNYDLNGNPTLLGKSNDVTTSFIYGFDNQYKMAQAEATAITDIAYTSFEDRYSNLNSGNWEITGTSQSGSQSTPFGKYCWYIAGSIYLQKKGLNNSLIYKVSYWSKNGVYSVTGSTKVVVGKTLNSWTYYEHTVNNISTLQITGTGYIDEVKVCPITTRMTTYNFKPLVGLLSITDPNNKTVFYEYDVLNRLKNIKDEDGNILNNYQYHYRN